MNIKPVSLLSDNKNSFCITAMSFNKVPTFISEIKILFLFMFIFLCYTKQFSTNYY